MVLVVRWGEFGSGHVVWGSRKRSGVVRSPGALQARWWAYPVGGPEQHGLEARLCQRS